MANYNDAQAEWDKAVRAANGDETLAERLLLARILREMIDQSVRMEAVEQATMGRKTLGLGLGAKWRGEQK